MRIELPKKGKRQRPYTIDVQVPGMLYGAILRAPVEGAGPGKIDDTKARAIPGVVEIVRLPYGVGVIAEAVGGVQRQGCARRHLDPHRQGVGFRQRNALVTFAAAARDISLPTKLWAKEGDAPAALKTAAKVDRSGLPQRSRLSRPDGAAERGRVGVAEGTLRAVVRRAVEDHRGHGRGRCARHQADKIVYHDMLMGGGFGRRGHRDEEYVHDAVVLSNAAEAGQGDVDARGRRPQRPLQPAVRALPARRLRRLRQAGRVPSSQGLRRGDGVPGPGEVRTAEGPRRHRVQRPRCALLRDPQPAGEAVPRESGLRTSSLRGIAHLTNIFAIELFMDELARKRGVDPATFRRDLVKANPRAVAIIDRVADGRLGRKRDGSALGFTYMNYSGTQIALVAEVTSTARPVRCGCRTCGRRSIPASRSSPTTSWRRPRAASSTASDSRSGSASRSTTARCRS